MGNFLLHLFVMSQMDLIAIIKLVFSDLSSAIDESKQHQNFLRAACSTIYNAYAAARPHPAPLDGPCLSKSWLRANEKN